jgi:DNA-directed RNA polymerase subunit alpha
MVLNLDEKQIAVKPVEQTADRGVFAVGPLPRGFGHTIGNTLRRVLLSSLEGAAISQVKFSGVPHQFTTIPGVKEDVVDLTLNLKQVRLKIEGDQPVALGLSKKGPGKVTAGDLKVPAGVEIANPNIHLATLADKKTVLEAELVAEPGRGYVPCEERESKIGVIPLDCVFTPILNVSYKVEPTRVGQVSDYDLLTIEIVTDKTIKPLEALVTASEILTTFFARVGLGEKAKGLPEKTTKTARRSVDLEELELPLRTFNCLKKAKISSASKLAKMDDEDILQIKNIGEKALKDIVRALKKEGLR